MPPDARVPFHRGPGGYGNWQPKALALINYAVAGAAVFSIALTATFSAISRKPALGLIAPLVILLIFFSQYFAVMAAVRNAGRDD